MTSQPTAFSARLTPSGRGAIAVIGVAYAPSDWNETDPPLFRAVNGRSWRDQPVGRLLYGQWGCKPVEDVVVCRTDAERFEIHCHGGDAAVRRIQSDLTEQGIPAILLEEWRMRTFDWLDAELDAALSQAITARTADLLLEQRQGCLQRAFDALSQQPPPALLAPSLLKWAEFGQHLTQPWQLVITGRPNVGKSSLINALLGYERAIVADQPGTTRDVVTALTAFDGWPVQLSDTAGLRGTDSELEAAGIARARRALQQADLRVIVLDISEPPTEFDLELLSESPDDVVIAHKSDLVDVWQAQLPGRALRVSSRTGEGLAELQRALVRRLVPKVPPPGTPIPVTARQVALLRSLGSQGKGDA